MLSERTTKRIFALLILVALLFCHGLLGALHQICDQPGQSSLSGEHSSHAHTGGSDGHPGAHLGCSGYAAALISILFGAVVGLLLSGVRMWSKPGAAPLLFGRSLPPLVLCPERRPVAPLTQVFRL